MNEFKDIHHFITGIFPSNLPHITGCLIRETTAATKTVKKFKIISICHRIVSLIISQLILPEMEDRHPKGTLVTIEEEPRILQRIQVANDMRLPCWRIALGTHDSNLLSLASHILHKPPATMIPKRTKQPKVFNTFFIIIVSLF